MVAQFLLDTNICIYALSGQYPKLRQRIDRLSLGQAVVSIIAYGELHFGIAKSKRKDDALQLLAAFITQIPVQTLPTSSAEHYGAIRADLAAQGNPIGANDLWIAAHARAANLTIVTNNTREFQRVAGLKIQNWVAS